MQDEQAHFSPSMTGIPGGLTAECGRRYAGYEQLRGEGLRAECANGNGAKTNGVKRHCWSCMEIQSKRKVSEAVNSKAVGYRDQWRKHAGLG